MSIGFILLFVIIGSIAFFSTLTLIICLCRGKPKKPEKTQGNTQTVSLEAREQSIKAQYVSINVLPPNDPVKEEIQLNNERDQFMRGISQTRTEISELGGEIDPAKFKTYEEIVKYMEEEKKKRERLNQL